MLFVSLPRLDLLPAVPPDADGIELRLDLVGRIELDALRAALRAPLPVMLTFRGAAQEHEGLIEQLLALEPPFLDLDGGMRPAFLERVLTRYPATKFVLSSHDAPHAMQYPAYTYKIARTTPSALDALRLLVWAKQHPGVSAICMGERGAFARVLGPVVGNRIDYACLDAAHATAPGQIPVRELLDVYRYRSLSPATAVYGLIGDPVAHSVGHLYHNRAFRERGVDAVYVKMALQAQELPEFWPLAEQLGIRGLSVTSPLKEAVLPGSAINTMCLTPHTAHNTDGVAALDCLERRGAVRGKRLVILGAGGTARAVAREATRRGAVVWILNRTLTKARTLAAEIGGSAGSLADLAPDYDVLVQCTPAPLVVKHIPPHALVMDVVYSPRETPLLRAAQVACARVVYGEEMFAAQAAQQQAIWSGA